MAITRNVLNLVLYLAPFENNSAFFLLAGTIYRERSRVVSRWPISNSGIVEREFYLIGHLEKFCKEQFAELYGESKVSGIQKPRVNGATAHSAG